MTIPKAATANAGWLPTFCLTSSITTGARNAPMRAVNLGLGYKPIPDEIGFRGPLAGAGAR